MCRDAVTEESANLFGRTTDVLVEETEEETEESLDSLALIEASNSSLRKEITTGTESNNGDTNTTATANDSTQQTYTE